MQMVMVTLKKTLVLSPADFEQHSKFELKVAKPTLIEGEEIACDG